MNYFSVTTTALKSFGNDKVSVWAASLAYATVFSLSPLLLVLTGLAGIFFGEQAIQGKLFEQLAGILGKDAAALLEKGVSNTTKPTENIISTIIGFIVLLIGATSIFGQMQQAFNAIWKVETKPKAGIPALIRSRLLSFSLLLIIAFLIAISVGLSFFTHTAANFIGSFFSSSAVFIEGFNFVISFMVLTILFAAMFKVLPDVIISFKALFPGAVITAMLFVVGKFILGWYIGRSSYTSTYGAAGSLLVILVWVYYSVLLVLLGVEITKAYTQHAGINVPPSKNAVSTTAEKETQSVELSKNGQFAQTIGQFITKFIFFIFDKKQKKKR